MVPLAIKLAQLLTNEMFAYMLMVIMAAFAGSKLFKRFKKEISPRESFMWFAWTGMLVSIIVFSVYLGAPMTAIKAVWCVLSGLIAVRFLTEDRLKYWKKQEEYCKMLRSCNLKTDRKLRPLTLRMIELGPKNWTTS